MSQSTFQLLQAFAICKYFKQKYYNLWPSVVQLLLTHGPLYKNMTPCGPFQTNVTRLKIKQEQIQIYKI